MAQGGDIHRGRHGHGLDSDIAAAVGHGVHGFRQRLKTNEFERLFAGSKLGSRAEDRLDRAHFAWEKAQRLGQDEILDLQALLLTKDQFGRAQGNRQLASRGRDHQPIKLMIDQKG